MGKTMIKVDTDTRDLIKSLGHMGETYDEVLRRMYQQTTENMVAKALLDTTGYVSLKDILKRRKLV